MIKAWVAQRIGRFLRYTAAGTSTFALDLFFLYMLTDALGYNYLFSAALAFIISVTINYQLSRRYVFKGTLRSVKASYVLFLLIGLVGLIAVTGFMALFVEVFHWNYLISRIVIACIVGFWNYLMNLYVNFKVAGKDAKDVDFERKM